MNIITASAPAVSGVPPIDPTLQDLKDLAKLLHEVPTSHTLPGGVVQDFETTLTEALPSIGQNMPFWSAVVRQLDSECFHVQQDNAPETSVDAVSLFLEEDYSPSAKEELGPELYQFQLRKLCAALVEF